MEREHLDTGSHSARHLPWAAKPRSRFLWKKAKGDDPVSYQIRAGSFMVATSLLTEAVKVFDKLKQGCLE